MTTYVVESLLLNLMLVALIFWLITRIRYTIDGRHVRVVLLGITLRKIALDDIESVDASAPFWNEHWCNTLWACGRIVCIRRKTGWFRNFIITPANRDEFIKELQSRLSVSR